ncbi:uncharacterized protein TRAVEDRAFT_33498 [Trametes versicolor FP-101664 SS1]|uniref:uncharacterized protein n=1 Tax=Trametes versicolor (strain FP-101664) TaxID=717944 RepID=UPI000462439D|nr:uncharacterized protein TRAVEDRAFT_33498 [Trametes versicolor FP-101664 SS1]EIW64742.1 hypothetical protein TRAVEDRAFT_33498 [Trametes versicolor FP-101664 SS1]
MRIPLTLFALASTCVSALALDFKGRVQWNTQCPNLKALGQTKVVLDNGKWSGGVTRDGSFVIPDVPAGTYVLSVLAHDHFFEQMRVDIYESDTLPEVRPYFPGTPLSPAAPATLPYPLVLSARGRYDYFVPRESFNVIAMFKNPMMMMMLGAGVLVLLMPTLMKNMDPEVMEEFKERHAKMTNLQSSLQSGDLASGFSQLLASGDEPKAAASGPSKGASSGGAKQRSGKGKRR